MPPWEKYSGGAAQTAPIMGPGKMADPYEARDQKRKDNADRRGDVSTELQISRFRAEERERGLKREKEVKEAAEAQAKVGRAKDAASYNLRKVLTQIEKVEADAKDNNGWLETGTSGSIARAVLPDGTAGADLAKALQTIDAASAFTSLQQMRDNSPTGGALGQVTERELDLLKSSVANLDPNQSQQQFLDSLQVARDHYNHMLSRIEKEEQEDAGGQAVAAPADNPNQDLGITVDAAQVEPDTSNPRTLDAGAPELAEYRKRNPEAVTVYMNGKGEPIGFEDVDGEFIVTVHAGGRKSHDGSLTDDFKAGVGDVAEGVGDLVGLLSNPLNAGINAVAGTNLSTDMGQTFRDASGMPDSNNELASAINKGGIGALSGAGLATAAQGIARGGAKVVTNALAQAPAQQVVGGMSAGGSAEGARQAGAPVPVQVAAGLVGGMTGFGGASAVKNALAPKQASDLGQAAARQDVPMLPADAGGAVTRRLTGAAAQSPLSASPIAGAAQKSQAAFKQAADRSSGGAVQYPEDAGETIARAGQRFTKESQQRGNNLYERAGKMAEGISIKPKGAIKAIDDEISQLSAAKETNAPLIKVLEGFKADLSANKSIRVSGMRDLRSAAQTGAYSQELRSTPSKRVLGNITRAIGDDIERGLMAGGRENAAKAFRTADTYWRERVQYIDDVLEPIIGNNKSGESVVRSVEQMARGKGKGVRVLQGLIKSVGKDEMRDIQATIISRMGRATDGQQNAAGDAYSSNTFLTNWSKMSARGKTTLFPDKGLRANLDDLAKIADGGKEAGRYANHSNTAGGIMGNTLVLGGVAYANPVVALLGAGSQYMTGKLLSSPRFAQWLARTAKTKAPIPAQVKRLDAIASSEPIIANDIASVKQFLMQAPSTTRAAASDDVSEKRPIPPQ